MNIMKAVMAAFFAATVFTAQGATVGYYRFETENGAAVTNNQPVLRVDDLSGNGNHMTVFATHGGTVFATNQYKVFSGNTPFPSRIPLTAANNVAYMGSDINYLRTGMACTNFTGLGGKTKFTVEAYIKKLAGDGGGDRTFVELYTGIGDGTWVTFRTKMSNLSDVASTNNLSVSVPGCGSFATPYMADIYTHARHVAIVVSHNATYTADFTFYVDGVQVYTTNYAHATPSGNIVVSIGDQYGYGAAQLNGIIDEVRISNTALTPNQFLNCPPAGTIVSVR